MRERWSIVTVPPGLSVVGYAQGLLSYRKLNVQLELAKILIVRVIKIGLHFLGRFSVGILLPVVVQSYLELVLFANCSED